VQQERASFSETARTTTRARRLLMSVSDATRKAVKMIEEAGDE